MSCRIDLNGPDDETLRRILSDARTIAVVGLSPRPERDSYVVAAYLQRQGYRIVPINPGADEILGEPAYPELAAVPESITIDIVDVFRRPETVPPVIEASAARGVPTVWLQLGADSEAATALARTAGIALVWGQCIKVAHARVIGTAR